MSKPTPASGQSDGRTVRWERHNRERRQQIIDAAIAVVEDHEPGARIQVQLIADRAHVTRTVLYRHFTDRADLDRAVRAAILDRLSAELLPAVTLEGTISEIVERTIARYVSWAIAHPSLHRLAESDAGGDNGDPLQRGLERIAGQVAELIRTALEAVPVPVRPDQWALLGPLTFGLVGAVFSAVRQWLAQDLREPPAPLLVAALSDSVWYLVDGHARTLGLQLDRHQPVQEMLAEIGSIEEPRTRFPTG